MAHIPSVTLKETTHPPTHPLLLGSIALAALSGKDDAPHAFRKHLVPLQARYPHPALIPDCQRWAILKRIWRRSIVARVLSKHCFFPLFLTRFYARRFFVFSLTFFSIFFFFCDGHVNTAGTSCAAKSKITFSSGHFSREARDSGPNNDSGLNWDQGSDARFWARLQSVQIFILDTAERLRLQPSAESHSNVLLRCLFIKTQIAVTKEKQKGKRPPGG